MKKEKAFTIIELLVVIAIIGLLSGIVLISQQGARERGRIGKGMAFFGHVQRSLGAYTVTAYDFNDGTASDVSGNNNNCTIYGAVSVAGMAELGNALNFNGVNDYVECGNAASLNITDEITIEVWFKAFTDTNGWDRLVAKSTPTAVFPFTMYGVLFVGSNYVGDEVKGNLRFEIASGGQQHIIYTKTVVPVGEWMYAVATYDAANKMRLYLNGALDSGDMWRYDSVSGVIVNTLLSGKIDTNNVPLSIGRSYYNLDYFNGVIDEVRIYNQALSLSEIQKHYAEGMEIHKLAKE